MEGMVLIGDRMKEMREKNNFTQSALAKKLDLSRSAINAWEMGISIPSAQYLMELSKLFKVSVDYLLELNEKEYHYRNDLAGGSGAVSDSTSRCYGHLFIL